MFPLLPQNFLLPSEWVIHEGLNERSIRELPLIIKAVGHRAYQILKLHATILGKDVYDEEAIIFQIEEDDVWMKRYEDGDVVWSVFMPLKLIFSDEAILVRLEEWQKEAMESERAKIERDLENLRRELQSHSKITQSITNQIASLERKLGKDLY